MSDSDNEEGKTSEVEKAEEVGSSEKETKKVKKTLRSKGPVLLKGGSKFVRDKLQGKTFLVPSCITVVGIFCGFLAILKAFEGDYQYACKCILLAIVLDGLDGRVARSLNATSAFGREFDSLSDLIAFGVAPAVLTYSWAFSKHADEFGILVSFFFVVCCATRLARFNITTSEGDGAPTSAFEGLPSPGAAAAIASIIFCFPAALESQLAVAFILFYTFFIGSLMVSSMAFFSVKRLKLNQGNPRIKLVLLSLAVALVWKYSQFMVLAISTLYCMSGVIGLLWGRFFPKSWDKQQDFMGIGS